MLFIILALLGVATASSVEFENSYVLDRLDGSICTPMFVHESFLFTSCATTTGNYEIQVWDCTNVPCFTDHVFETDMRPGYKFDYMTYERINDYTLRFMTGDDYYLYLFECLIPLSASPECELAFKKELREQMEFHFTYITGMQTDDMGYSLIVGYGVDRYDGSRELVTGECEQTTYYNWCILDRDKKPSEYYSASRTISTATILDHGETIIYGDPECNNGRGCIIRLVRDYNRYQFKSVMMADESTPLIHLGHSMIARTVPGTTNITILAGAPDWVNSNGYRSGAVFAFFCSDQFSNPCLPTEIQRYEGPASGCLYNDCKYGQAGTIAVGTSGYEFAVGSPNFKGGIGNVDIYTCEELPMILCSYADSFNPNHPPSSDLYGTQVIYDGFTLISLASVWKDRLWTVDTFFNDTKI